MVTAVHDISDMNCVRSITFKGYFVTHTQKKSNCAEQVICVLLQQKYAFQSSSRPRNEDNMTEKVWDADFKTLLSPALWDTYQKKYFQVSLYLFWVEGEGVSISWQSMSGEREKINDIIALTTRFSYLNWQHQLKLFHSFLQ